MRVYVSSGGLGRGRGRVRVVRIESENESERELLSEKISDSWKLVRVLRRWCTILGAGMFR